MSDFRYAYEAIMWYYQINTSMSTKINGTERRILVNTLYVPFVFFIVATLVTEVLFIEFLICFAV